MDKGLNEEYKMTEKKAIEKSLVEYFALIEQHPELVANQSAPIKIIRNVKTIQNWRKENPNPENKIGVLMQDKYITVLRDLVKFSDGEIAGYDRILNTAGFRNGGMGSVILPVMDRKILLIKIFRHSIRQWSIEIPRGFGEPNTSSLETAYNELFEEIGGRIMNDLMPLGVLHNNTGLDGNGVQLYLAYLDKIGVPRKEEGIEKIVWVNTIQLETMIEKGEITDAFTISTYARARLKGLLDM